MLLPHAHTLHKDQIFKGPFGGAGGASSCGEGKGQRVSKADQKKRALVIKGVVEAKYLPQHSQSEANSKKRGEGVVCAGWVGGWAMMLWADVWARARAPCSIVCICLGQRVRVRH